MVHVMHMLFMCFFMNLKSLSEDKMPVHALDIFTEKPPNPIKHKKWGSNFNVAPKLCIFLYNAMETTGDRQGMGIMHSDVLW